MFPGCRGCKGCRGTQQFKGATSEDKTALSKYQAGKILKSGSIFRISRLFFTSVGIMLLAVSTYL